MKIRIETLRPAAPMKQVLERAGWQVTQEEEALLLSDDLVDSEEIARRRLYDLGLLISGRVRIEFLSMEDGPHRMVLNRTSSARWLEEWRRTRSRPRRSRRPAGSS